MKKSDVVALVEEWLIEREEYQIKPSHPLATAQEMQLEEGGSSGPKETRPAGRSRPPIRDMRGANARVDRTMSVVRAVDKTWYDALVYYAVTGTLKKAAEQAKCSKPIIRSRFDSATACFMGAWEA